MNRPASPPGSLPDRLERVLRRIAEAEQRYGRDPGSVQLLAVGKRHPVAAIETLHEAGQRHFGENQLAEAQEKMARIQAPLYWHFIGPIQSNKTRGIAQAFDWVHSIDRRKILQRLASQRPEEARPLECLIQVNIGGEESKSGVPPEAVDDLLRVAADCPRLRVRGLMCIPPPSDDPAVQRRHFCELRTVFASVDRPPALWDTLSMGMSNDLESAVAEGATMVRIGTDLFGPRPAH